MKPKSPHCVVVVAFALGLAFFVVANSGIGQGTNIQAEAGNSSLPYNTPSQSSQVQQEEDTNINNTNPDDKKTLYDKSGATATPDANPYGKREHRGRVNYGKKTEHIVITSKSEGLKKTKDGSSDATEPTGVFKNSLLDTGLSVNPARAQPSATPSTSVNTLRTGRDAPAALSATSSSSPSREIRPHARDAAPGSHVDLTLGIAPEPTPSATATPRR